MLLVSAILCGSPAAAEDGQKAQEPLTMHYYYKAPRCLDDKAWQFANIKSPKELLADSRCKEEKQKFMADKGKLIITCGKAEKHEFFADSARCERRRKGRY